MLELLALEQNYQPQDIHINYCLISVSYCWILHNSNGSIGIFKQMLNCVQLVNNHVLISLIKSVLNFDDGNLWSPFNVTKQFLGKWRNNGNDYNYYTSSLMRVRDVSHQSSWLFDPQSLCTMDLGGVNIGYQVASKIHLGPVANMGWWDR